MIIMLVVWSHHAIDMIYDVRMRTDVNLPSAYRGGETEVLILDLVSIALCSTKELQVVYRFTLSLLIGDGNCAFDILLLGRLAVLARCVARADSVLVSCKASDICKALKLSAVALMERLVSRSAEECVTRLC